MLDFIEYSNKIKELYIGKDTINKIIEEYKKSILKNEEAITKVLEIDRKNCDIDFNIKKIVALLDTYKNEDPIEDKNKPPVR